LAGLTQKLKLPVSNSASSRSTDTPFPLVSQHASSAGAGRRYLDAGGVVSGPSSVFTAGAKATDLAGYENDLKTVERSHLQYLGVNNVLKLTQPEFTERLVRALATRLRVVYESALGEVELWNKSAAAQLDAQLRERRRNFGRRLRPSSVFAKLHQASTNALPRSSSRKWL
jgi:hypothetical protein